jgi:ribosome-associated toxin RatA of RatAB toxin-antitoxin module
MRRIELEAVIRSTPAEEVFDAIRCFERYPDLAPHVQATTVHETFPAPVGRSSWELHFRSGLLHWNEEERFLRDALRLEFVQTTGDFDQFEGCWVLRQEGPDTALHFHADVDFGIPSMAEILDPIADRVIRESVAWVLVGMFDEVELDSQLDLTTRPGPVGTGAP